MCACNSWLCSGLPSKLSTREELSTLLSVSIFTSTAQHAATNNGQVLNTFSTYLLTKVRHPLTHSLSLSRLMFFLQFDWCAWVPNTPCTMRHPPPTDKDAVTMEMIMDTLPDVSQSCVQMAITWHLGRAQPDAVSVHFCLVYVVIDRTINEVKGLSTEALRGKYNTRKSCKLRLFERCCNTEINLFA